MGWRTAVPLCGSFFTLNHRWNDVMKLIVAFLLVLSVCSLVLLVDIIIFLIEQLLRYLKE